MPAEIFFPQSLGKVKVEMTQEWRRTNSWSKQHITFLVQSVRLVSAKEKPDVLSNTGEATRFSPLASLFETAETFWLKAFKSNSARGNAQHGKLQAETKNKLTWRQKLNPRSHNVNCLLLKVGLIAPTIIKLVPHLPLSYFLFVPPSKHITNRKKAQQLKGYSTSLQFPSGNHTLSWKTQHFQG